MIVRFDSLNRFITPKVTLCNPCSRYINGEIDYSIGVVSGIKNFTMDYNFNAQSTGKFEYADLTNTVEEENYKLHYKEIYSKLQEYRYLFIQDFGFCIITNVSETQTIAEGKKILTKTVSFSSCDKELENYEVPIFTTDDVDTVTMTLQEVINQITATYSNWTCDEADIDESLKTDSSGGDIYRTFQDISAENLYDFLFGADGSVEDAFDCIIDCDYIQRKLRFYSKDNYVEKHMTNIVLSDNLLKDLSFDSSSDELYSALSVEGDNDLNIRAVNPNGTNIIYNFDRFKKEGWMPQSLVEAVENLENNIAMVSEPVVYNGVTYPSLYTQLCTQLEIAQRDYYEAVQQREAIRAKLKEKELALTNMSNTKTETLADEEIKINAMRETVREINKLRYGSLEPFSDIVNYIVPVTDESWITDWKDNGLYQDEICFVKKDIVEYQFVTFGQEEKALEGLDQVMSIYDVVTPSLYNDTSKTLYRFDDSKINWSNIYFYFNPFLNSAYVISGSSNPDCWFNATKKDLKLYLNPNPDISNPVLKIDVGVVKKVSGGGVYDMDIQKFGFYDTKAYTLNLYKIEYGFENYGINSKDDVIDDVSDCIDSWKDGKPLGYLEYLIYKPNSTNPTFAYYHHELKFKYDDTHEDIYYIGFMHTTIDSGSTYTHKELYAPACEDTTSYDGYQKYIGFRSPITGEFYPEGVDPCIGIRQVFVDQSSKYVKKYKIVYYCEDGSNYPVKEVWLNYRDLKKYVKAINKRCSINVDAKKITNIYFKKTTSATGNDFYILVIATPSLNKIFSGDNIKRLYSYIRVGTYVNSDITITDNSTDKEKVEQSAILLDKGKGKLKDISENLKKISVTSKDFIFNKEFVAYSTQLESGAVIRIKPNKVLASAEDGMIEEYYLTNFSVDYDAKTLNMTFGNKLNRFDLKSLFDDVLGDVSKSAFQIRKIKNKI